jgi:hypothetical protein
MVAETLDDPAERRRIQVAGRVGGIRRAQPSDVASQHAVTRVLERSVGQKPVEAAADAGED